MLLLVLFIHGKMRGCRVPTILFDSCLSICEGDIFIDFLENLQGSDFEGGKRVERGRGRGRGRERGYFLLLINYFYPPL
jgi:hypothetical protein